MISAEVDMKGLNRVLAGLSDALMGSSRGSDRSDSQTIIRDSGASLGRRIMHAAPPSRRSSSKSSKADQKAGEKAILDDLRKLIGVADADTIAKFTTEHGRQNIDGWLAMDDGSTIHVVWDYAAASGSELEAIHQQHRNTRGRVSRFRRGSRGHWYRTAITTPALRDRYIRMVQKRVGLLKASWGASAMKVKDGALRGIPAWVKRHIPSRFSVTDLANADNKTKPGIAFGSNASGNGMINKAVINGEIRAEMHAMEKRTMLVISGYAKDVRNGMKPKRRAKQYAGT